MAPFSVAKMSFLGESFYVLSAEMAVGQITQLGGHGAVYFHLLLRRRPLSLGWSPGASPSLHCGIPISLCVAGTHHPKLFLSAQLQNYHFYPTGNSLSSFPDIFPSYQSSYHAILLHKNFWCFPTVVRAKPNSLP